MSVLVTSGAGYIGSHMVLALLDAGEDVTVIDNLSTGFRWAVPERAKFVEGDVGDEVLLRRLLAGGGTDAILHFVGFRGCRTRWPTRSTIISTTPANRAH